MIDTDDWLVGHLLAIHDTRAISVALQLPGVGIHGVMREGDRVKRGEMVGWIVVAGYLHCCEQ